MMKSDCQEGQLGDCQSLVEGGGVQVEGGGVQVEGGGQDQTIASNPLRVGVSEKTFQDQDAGSQQRVGSMRVRQIRDVRQENRFSIFFFFRKAVLYEEHLHLFQPISICLEQITVITLN